MVLGNTDPTITGAFAARIKQAVIERAHPEFLADLSE
jgi:hypothetical protein